MTGVHDDVHNKNKKMTVGSATVGVLLQFWSKVVGTLQLPQSMFEKIRFFVTKKGKQFT